MNIVVHKEVAVHYPQEFLNLINLASFLPHDVQLKIRIPIMHYTS